MILTEYDIQYTSQKAIKGSVLSDYLAEQPIDDYQPMRFDFPDEDIMFLKSKDCEEPLPEEGPDPESKWIMMFDGAVNVNGRGVGAVLITPEGVHMPFCARITFPCTNNEAEYEACILGLEEAINLRIKTLDVVEEKGLAAICHGQLYQRRMKRAFDQKVRPREYQVGELVLKRILPPNTDHRGKWTPNYEGPYVVKRVFSGGALMLTTMDGEDFPSPVNSDAVKKYFA